MVPRNNITPGITREYSLGILGVSFRSNSCERHARFLKELHARQPLVATILVECGCNAFAALFVITPSGPSGLYPAAVSGISDFPIIPRQV